VLGFPFVAIAVSRCSTSGRCAKIVRIVFESKIWEFQGKSEERLSFSQKKWHEIETHHKNMPILTKVNRFHSKEEFSSKNHISSPKTELSRAKVSQMSESFLLCSSPGSSFLSYNSSRRLQRQNFLTSRDRGVGAPCSCWDKIGVNMKFGFAAQSSQMNP
jgi:hypothetical protein